MHQVCNFCYSIHVFWCYAKTSLSWHIFLLFFVPCLYCLSFSQICSNKFRIQLILVWTYTMAQRKLCHCTFQTKIYWFFYVFWNLYFGGRNLLVFLCYFESFPKIIGGLCNGRSHNETFVLLKQEFTGYSNVFTNQFVVVVTTAIGDLTMTLLFFGMRIYWFFYISWIISMNISKFAWMTVMLLRLLLFATMIYWWFQCIIDSIQCCLN